MSVESRQNTDSWPTAPTLSSFRRTGYCDSHPSTTMSSSSSTKRIRGYHQDHLKYCPIVQWFWNCMQNSILTDRVKFVSRWQLLWWWRCVRSQRLELAQTNDMSTWHEMAHVDINDWALPGAFGGRYIDTVTVGLAHNNIHFSNRNSYHMLYELFRKIRPILQIIEKQDLTTKFSIASFTKFGVTTRSRGDRFLKNILTRLLYTLD